VWSKIKFENVKWQKLHLPNVLNKLDILLESRSLSSEESSLKVSSLDELEKNQQLEEIVASKGSISLAQTRRGQFKKNSLYHKCKVPL